MKNIKYIFSVAMLWCLISNINAQTKTALLRNGTTAQKFDIVFVGDGFTAAEQPEFNRLVDNYFKAIFTHENGGIDDVFSEIQDALNVWRVNLNSVQSGIDLYVCPPGNDEPGESCGKQNLVNRNNALNMRYSGCWDCCWMTFSGDTRTRINSMLSTTRLAGAEYTVVILNETGFGGCSYGDVLSITKSTSNRVLLHELGHSIGDLADEYDRPGCFTADPSDGDLAKAARRNVDTDENSSKWSVFRRSGGTTGMPVEYNVGAFEGAVYKKDCIYRPTSRSTMNGNDNLFNPPSYDEIRKRNKTLSNFSFEKVISGNFGGDSRGDVLIHYGNYLTLHELGIPDGFTGSGRSYRVKSSKVTTKAIKGAGGTWFVRPNDQFFTGDFNGDGKDDLLVFNPHAINPKLGLLKSNSTGFECLRIYTRSLNGWQMKGGDQIKIGDFNGDGKDDFYIFNNANWDRGYMGMFRSTGSSFAYVKRYDRYMPGHFMTNKDKYFVADVNGDKKDELIAVNTQYKTTRMFHTDGRSISLKAEYHANLPGWTGGFDDEYYVADFNGDGKDDLYIFNGKNWGSLEYLVMLASTGSGYRYVKRYDNSIPGWDMENGDRFFVADHNGDNKEDLIAYNSTNWGTTKYLARLSSNGTALSGRYQRQKVGSWALGTNDDFTVCKDTGSGSDHLFVHNTNWFGYMIPYSSNYHLQAIYKDYIHTFKHHDFGWY